MSTTVDGINYSLSGSNATITGTTSNVITTVTIPSTITYLGNTYNVTSIGHAAFQYCSKLTRITIPNGVTSIGSGAFYGCSSLASITIPNGVTSIKDDTFYNCPLLAEITIPSSVTNIGYGAFHGCSSLAIVTIPNGVTTIGPRAFKYCSSLASITIPNSVTTIGDEVFSYCSSLASIVVDSENTNFSSLDNVLFNKAQTILIQYAPKLSGTTYVIPSSVTTIGSGAFAGCSSLTSITIPNSVLTIGDYAFYNCSSLASITIPNGVLTIGQTPFAGCYNIQTINNAPITVSWYSISISRINNNTPVFNGVFTTFVIANKTVINAFYISSNLGINILAHTDDDYGADFVLNGNEFTGSGTTITSIPDLDSQYGAQEWSFWNDGTSSVLSYKNSVNQWVDLTDQFIFTILSTSPPSLNPPSLKPSLSTLKSQNASKATYTTYNYSLSDLVNSGLYTLIELKVIGYVLGELKAFFTTETLITSWLFTGLELKQEGLIESGITFFIIVIVFNGVFSVRRTYALNNTNKEDTYYNVVFEGQYFPTVLTSITI